MSDRYPLLHRLEIDQNDSTLLLMILQELRELQQSINGKWEFEITPGPFSEEFLNEHGEQGWELVAIITGVSDKDCVWKRRRQES